MNNLKQEIWDLSNQVLVKDGVDVSDSVIKDLFSRINEVENEEDRLELYTIFVAKMKDLFVEWQLTLEGLYGNILEVRTQLKEYGNLTEEQIDNIFQVNAFDADNIPFVEEEEVEERVENEIELNEEDLEITKINARIFELEAKLGGKDAVSLKAEIEELEKKKSEEFKSINDEIALIENELNNRGVVLEELKLFPEYESKTDDELNAELRSLEARKIDSGENNDNATKKVKSSEELEKDLKIAKNEQAELYAKSGREELTNEEKARFEKLGEEINKLSIIIEDRKGYFDDEYEAIIDNLDDFHLGHNLNFNEDLRFVENDLQSSINERAELYAKSRREELTNEEKAGLEKLDEEIKKLSIIIEDRRARGVYFEWSLDDLNDRLEKAKAEQARFSKVKILSSERETSLRELDKYIEKITAVISEKKGENKANNEEKTEINKRITAINSILRIRKGKGNIDIDKKIQELETQKKELEDRVNLWKDPARFGSKPDLDGKIEDLNKKIKDLEVQIAGLRAIKGKSDDELLEELKALREKQKDVQSKYDKEIADKQALEKDAAELTVLKTRSNIYSQIQIEAIEKFEKSRLSNEDLLVAIEQFVNEHRLIEQLKNYPKFDKMKDELIKSTYNAIRNRKIDKKENNKKTALKVMSTILGFAGGVVLHSNPTVGVIMGGVWAVKAVKRSVNFITKKFPESKVTKIINGITEKVTEFGNNFKEKHPKIAAGVEKVRTALKSDYAKWAFRGFTAGYLVGNLLDRLPEAKAEEKVIKDDSVDYKHVIKDVDDTNIITDVPQIDPIELEPGKVFDISGIGEGLKASTSTDYVNLATQFGKEAVVDKFVTLPNGEVMVHFKQINGAGYAWFKEADVLQYLTKVAQAAAKSSGMSLR